MTEPRFTVVGPRRLAWIKTQPEWVAATAEEINKEWPGCVGKYMGVMIYLDEPILILNGWPGVTERGQKPCQ